MENEYICRIANAKDIDRIFAIENECFTKPWTINMFIEDIVVNDKARYYVVEYNTEIIGYAGYWHILDEAHITNIAIKPEFQQKGIGAFLLKNMLLMLLKDNIETATLEVKKSNKAAIKLYMQAGFEIEGRRKAYYENGEDALIMWKEMK